MPRGISNRNFDSNRPPNTPLKKPYELRWLLNGATWPELEGELGDLLAFQTVYQLPWGAKPQTGRFSFQSLVRQYLGQAWSRGTPSFFAIESRDKSADPTDPPTGQKIKAQPTCRQGPRGDALMAWPWGLPACPCDAYKGSKRRGPPRGALDWPRGRVGRASPGSPKKATGNWSRHAIPFDNHAEVKPEEITVYLMFSLWPILGASSWG